MDIFVDETFEFHSPTGLCLFSSDMFYMLHLFNVHRQIYVRVYYVFLVHCFFCFCRPLAVIITFLETVFLLHYCVEICVR